MMGGIDQQRQQAILQAGSDPRKLKQGYEQSVKNGSPDLAMLLGMQKLKSEKDAAAKEMQMQMEQQPQTIVEQREAELTGQTQQEVNQQRTPGMAQAGQQSKQDALQKQLMGKNGGGPPPNAAQTGIAQAASPQQFAAGGIVGYAGNGPQGQLIGMPADVNRPYTTADTESAIRKQIDMALAQGATVDQIKKSLGNNPAGLAYLAKKAPASQSKSQGKSPEEMMQAIQQKMQQQQAPTPVTQAPAKAVTPPPAGIASAAPGYKWGSGNTPAPAMPQTPPAPAPMPAPPAMPPTPPPAPPTQGLAAAASAPEEYLGKQITPQMQKTMDIAKGQKGRGILDPVANIGTGWKDQLAPKPAPVNPLAAEIASGDLINPPKQLPQPPENQTITEQGIQPRGLGLDPETKEARDILGGTMRGNPADREASERARYTKDMSGFKGNVGEQRDLRAKLQAELDAQNDPRKRRKERFSAFAAGAGGRNSSTMAGGIAGSYNARNDQEAKRLKGIAALEGMLGKETESNKAYGEGLGSAGVKAYDTSATRTDNAAKGVADIGLTAQANQLREQTNQMIANNDSDQKMITQLGVIEGRILTAQEKINDAMNEGRVGQQMMQLQNQLNKLDEDDPQRAVVQQAMQSLRNQVEQAVGGNSITILTQLREQLMQDLKIAPTATSGGTAGWGQAKKI